MGETIEQRGRHPGVGEDAGQSEFGTNLPSMNVGSTAASEGNPDIERTSAKDRGWTPAASEGASFVLLLCSSAPLLLCSSAPPIGGSGAGNSHPLFRTIQVRL